MPSPPSSLSLQTVGQATMHFPHGRSPPSLSIESAYRWRQFRLAPKVAVQQLLLLRLLQTNPYIYKLKVLGRCLRVVASLAGVATLASHALHRWRHNECVAQPEPQPFTLHVCREVNREGETDTGIGTDSRIDMVTVLTWWEVNGKVLLSQAFLMDITQYPTKY
jgi:hypothetical protein